MALKVLIVEDDDNISELISLYLEKEGFEVSVANDGGKGVLQFESFKPNIVLLDLMLPVLNGWEVCREIRNTSDTPIIMLTAKGETFDKVKGLEMGADDYIVKPFEIKGDIIPRLIDEIPILAILATQANGKTIVSDAQDLRNKESDRIKTIVDALSSLDVDIEEKPDGFIINGKKEFDKEIELETHLDHRLAMSYFVLSLINKKPMKIKGFNCINTSFPEFLDLAKQLGYGK